MFKANKNQVLIGIALLAIIVTGALVLANSNATLGNKLSFLRITLPMSADAIAKKSVDYLNKSVLQQGQVATLVSDSMAHGVVKMTIKIGTNTYDSYATTDGKLLFPEAFTIGTSTAASASQTTQPTGQVTPASVAKAVKTDLTAYIVSSCPYGLQMQRAIANAISNVPALANYITIRYIGAVSGNTITSMHGDGEAKENLRQICIRDEQPAKYWSYVSCYMKNATGTMPNGMPLGDSPSCQQQTGIDMAKLNACLTDPARGLADAKADFALDAKYNIQGSPTLVLNGAVIDETPFGGRSSDAIRNIICSSSQTAPAFCSTKLNTTPANTSFSLTYAGSGSTTAAKNNCAPTVQ